MKKTPRLLFHLKKEVWIVGDRILLAMDEHVMVTFTLLRGVWGDPKFKFSCEYLNTFMSKILIYDTYIVSLSIILLTVT